VSSPKNGAGASQRSPAHGIADPSKIAFDTTGRKRAEQTMRESEARFRALFDSNLVGIAFWDYPQDSITHANDAYLSLIGYTRAEFEPGKINWRDLTPPEYRDLDDIALHEARSNSVSKIYEKEYVRPDGKRTPIVTGLAAPGDSWREGLAFALDISERVRMQAQLFHSQKLESLSLLAGGIAHDFNNLLMGIVANVSLMMDDLPPDSPLHSPGENALAAIEQAARLTRQMLAYSGRGHYSVQPIGLVAQVEKISSVMKSSIKKGVALRLNLDPNLPRIQADPGQIQQVVMNLVQNADEAIETEGSVTVSASVRDVGGQDNRGRLAGAFLTPGKYALLEVSDTGCGMDDATQARMFDPFFTTKVVGRGLGLAVVLGIVRGHRGGIGVSSEPGKGSSFQVFFPVYQEPPAASG
jgi:PAS domain S-box-containing protein